MTINISLSNRGYARGVVNTYVDHCQPRWVARKHFLHTSDSKISIIDRRVNAKQRVAVAKKNAGYKHGSAGFIFPCVQKKLELMHVYT